MNEGTDVSDWLRSVGFPMPFVRAEVWKWYNHIYQVAEDLDISIEAARELPRNPHGVPLTAEEIENIRNRKHGYNNPDDWLEVEDPSHIAIHLFLNEDSDDNQHDLFRAYNIGGWTEDFFGEGTDLGYWDGEAMIWDIHISWEDFQKIKELRK